MDLKECKESLNASRIYLKTDFKIHLNKADNCADHCITYALSDPVDGKMQIICNDHQHNILCDRCELLPHSISKLKDIIEQQNIPQDLKEDMLSDLRASEANIIEWKRHLVRTVNQDKSRTEILMNLKPGEVLVILDWAMKFLPIAYREKQSDWFGQKGVNWHVTVCIFKGDDGSLKHRTFTHLIDGVKQDWSSVAAILENCLVELKRQLCHIENAFLRSDNAGCYHCGNLWQAIPGISERTGIFIKRYDYSEPQCGKSYCDAKIAHMRGKLRQVAASGFDILNAADMKEALDKNGGICGCQVANARIPYMENMSFPRCPMKGISKISNIKFLEGKIITWKAYGIGEGKEILWPLGEQDGSQIEILQGFIPSSSGTNGVIKEPKTESNNSDEAFACPEGGCTNSFTSYQAMQDHCLLGDHSYLLQKTSTYDHIKIRWKDACTDLSETINDLKYSTSESDIVGNTKLEMGWALKRERKVVRFLPDVKNYLKEIFDNGEKTGNKTHPSVVVKNMRIAVDENGRKRFKPDQYLAVGQITSYFSRLSALRRLM